MTKSQLRKLRKRLPKGWMGTLAKKTGYNQYHICNVLHGTRNNMGIIEQAVILAEEHSNFLKSITRRAEEL